MKEHIQKKIRLVIGINDFFVGGGQRLIVDILKQPIFVDFDIHLITCRHDSSREALLAELPAYVTHHRVNFRHLMHIRGWWRLHATLTRIKPDVVWTHFYFSNTVFRALRLFFHYQVIVVEHNTYVWKSWFQRTIDRILSRFTYKIVAVSQTVADFTSEQEHIPREKFVVIPNGVDLKRLAIETEGLTKDTAKQLLGLPTERSYIINVARLSSQKNHRLLIEAFSMFAQKHMNYDLLIIGDGPEQTTLENMVRDKNLVGRVRFLGTRMDVGRWYAASDFFVLTSKIEGFALVCIEAMSFGLPVISTRVAGPDVYIADGENGYLVVDDTQEVFERMMYVADLDEDRRRMMEQAARQTAQNYDVRYTAQHYNNLFLQACSDTIVL